jgi:glycosyltransferase involved in cell wall biosynthesis
MRRIFFWSPHIDSQIATVKSVTNSLNSLSKYQKYLKLTLINVFGEWNNFDYDKITVENLLENKSFLKKKFRGFLNSRIIYFQILFYSYFPLKKILSKKKPDFLIIHLLTSIPLILFCINNFQTKLILRISGLPKVNFFRYCLWKLASSKIRFVICPTEETRNFLLEKKIFDSKKVIFIPDPIIELKKINILKNKKIDYHFDKPYFLCIGRFTKQKNHIFLLNFFKNNPTYLKKFNLVIIGQGELVEKYKKIIEFGNLSGCVHILDYKNNVINYIKNASCVISPSLWEDPGFVMIEAACVGTPIITSDCPNGPKEFINSNECGFIFTSNNEKSFKKALDCYLNSSKEEVKLKIFNAKKKSRKYTFFYNASKILNLISNY